MSLKTPSKPTGTISSVREAREALAHCQALKKSVGRLERRARQYLRQNGLRLVADETE